MAASDREFLVKLWGSSDNTGLDELLSKLSDFQMIGTGRTCDWPDSDAILSRISPKGHPPVIALLILNDKDKNFSEEQIESVISWCKAHGRHKDAARVYYALGRGNEALDVLIGSGATSLAFDKAIKWGMFESIFELCSNEGYYQEGIRVLVRAGKVEEAKRLFEYGFAELSNISKLELSKINSAYFLAQMASVIFKDESYAERGAECLRQAVNTFEKRERSFGAMISRFGHAFKQYLDFAINVVNYARERPVNIIPIEEKERLLDLARTYELKSEVDADESAMRRAAEILEKADVEAARELYIRLKDFGKAIAIDELVGNYRDAIRTAEDAGLNDEKQRLVSLLINEPAVIHGDFYAAMENAVDYGDYGLALKYARLLLPENPIDLCELLLDAEQYTEYCEVVEEHALYEWACGQGRWDILREADMLTKLHLYSALYQLPKKLSEPFYH